MSKKADYLKNVDGVERRYIEAPVSIEQRGEGDDQVSVIEGYAFKYNKITEIGGWFREEILPGAADDVLNDDIRCLFNHNPSLILARSVGGKGTLSLNADKVGLKYSYVTPDRTYARDLEDAIKAGDVDKSSFAFRAKEIVWIAGENDAPDLRQIQKFEAIFDVSPVTFPAYQDTTVAKRSHDEFISETAEPDEQSEQKKDHLSVYEAQSIINKNNL